MNNNIHWQNSKVSYIDRCKNLKQDGLVIWLTGLSGSGKTTIANALESKLLSELGKKTFILDGDNIRHGLNSDLGFSDADRDENIRRIAEVAKLFKDAGMIVIVSFISPFEKTRKLAKKIVGGDNILRPAQYDNSNFSFFYEVFVKASFETCQKRDPKGLYKKVDKGEIKDFTGVGSDYEVPEDPDLVIDTDVLSVDESVEMIIQEIFLSTDFTD